MRLTKEMVTEAYEKTGMTPARFTFGNSERGCGMAAYARSIGSRYNVQKLTTFGEAYFYGWIVGWDGRKHADESSLLDQYGTDIVKFYDGVEDGSAAAEAVFTRAADRELVCA